MRTPTLEIGNLTAAIAAGGDIPSLAEALKARDRALRDIDAKLAAPVEMPDRDVLRAALELRTADWRGILRGPHVEQARLVLQHLLDLPIRGLFNEPKPKWVAAARPEGLAVGLVQSVASPIYASWNQLYLWMRAVDSMRWTACGGRRELRDYTDTARRLADRRGWSPSALPVEWLRGGSGNAFELCPERLFRVPHVKSLLHPEPQRWSVTGPLPEPNGHLWRDRCPTRQDSVQELS